MQSSLVIPLDAQIILWIHTYNLNTNIHFFSLIQKGTYKPSLVISSNFSKKVEEKGITLSRIQAFLNRRQQSLVTRSQLPITPYFQFNLGAATISRATSGGRREDQNTSGQRGNRFTISYRDISVRVAETNIVL